MLKRSSSSEEAYPNVSFQHGDFDFILYRVLRKKKSRGGLGKSFFLVIEPQCSYLSWTTFAIHFLLLQRFESLFKPVAWLIGGENNTTSTVGGAEK